MLQDWREEQVGECENGFEVAVHFRRDVEAMLQELLAHPEVSLDLPFCTLAIPTTSHFLSLTAGSMTAPCSILVTSQHLTKSACTAVMQLASAI